MAWRVEIHPDARAELLQASEAELKGSLRPLLAP